MKQYVVDAFTDTVFSGNPAAVCVMESWIPEDLMLRITKENNLSETAFAVRGGDGYRLRWFTPGGEIDLCGHATLATAFVIMNVYAPDLQSLSFQTLSGTLSVKRAGALYEMDFPAYALVPTAVTPALTEALGVAPVEAYLGRDLLCVLESEDAVRTLAPDMERVTTLDGLLLHVTAKGAAHDCVSRSFAPKLHVPEDPVCGSGHCHIIPYWARKTGKDTLLAYQASARGGTLYCRMAGNRVTLSGKAALYSESTIFV